MSEKNPNFRKTKLPMSMLGASLMLFTSAQIILQASRQFQKFNAGNKKNKPLGDNKSAEFNLKCPYCNLFFPNENIRKVHLGMDHNDETFKLIKDKFLTFYNE